jgi:hypothetical protein
VARQIVVIDDVAAAIAWLSTLGRAVVSPPAQIVREIAVRELAAAGCIIVPHGDFVEWVSRQLDQSVKWFVLDPLIQAELLPCDARRWHLTRVMRDGGHSHAHQGRPDSEFAGCECGIVDDAAHTGGTLLTALAHLTERGAVLDDVLVCSASESARLAVRRAFPDIAWAQLIRGDHDVLHLRDICPFLPFSGRRVVDKPHVAVASGTVEVRVPADGFADALWRGLIGRSKLRDGIIRARSEVPKRFATQLGRQPLVDDLPLLGAQVPLPLYRPQTAQSGLPLSALF